MNPGEHIEVQIEKIAPGGDGIAFHEGLACFVPFSAPHDRLRVRVQERKRDYIRAGIVDILEPSALRTEPPCPHYGICGGCNIMHLAYGEQLKAKISMVSEALRRVGSMETEVADIHAAGPWGYRNRAQFHVGRDGRLGYMRRGDSASLPLGSCPVLVSGLNQWLDRHWDSGEWKSRKGGKNPSDRFIVFDSDGRGYNAPSVEGKDGEIDIQILGKAFRFHVGGFFQSNLGMLEQLVPLATEGLGGERAADLYCGVGLFGSFLKDAFSKVVCVEQDVRAIGYASRNVGRGADFAALAMDAWTHTGQAKLSYDYVLLDPPRGGLSPSVRSWLLAGKPQHIGYVSCDPVAQARDIGILVRAGYVLETMDLFDFYPQTAHIESYARLALA